MSPAARADDTPQVVSAARLSSVDGQVQISQGNQVISDQAVANAPLFEGTRVTTGDDGRAEIQLEDGSVARLSPNSSLTLTALHGQGGAGDSEISLDTGLGYFELRGAGRGGTIRIGFGDSVVTAGGFTVVRISLDNPPGELAVFSGNAHIERGSAMTVDLHGGESVALNGADRATMTCLNRSNRIRGTHGTRTVTRCWRLKARRGPRRHRGLRTAAIRRGTIWMRTATGTTFRVRGISGRRMRQATRDSIHTGAGIGCGRRSSATSGYQVIPGVICPTNAGIGISTTVLGGVGRREWVAALPGGAAAIMG